MPRDEKIIEQLKEYFASRDDVSMAFLFGSQAKGTAIAESDTDIAVYFTPKERWLEWEEDTEYPAESDIWSATGKIAPTPSTDLIVLNRAPAMLAAEIIQNGIPLFVKDWGLYWRFRLTITDAAEEFRQIKDDWRAIVARSRSITYFDRERLADRIEFMERELQDLPKFEKLTFIEYQDNRDLRRNVERWVENIVNASIDISKTLLASEKKQTPMKYEEILKALGGADGFPHETADTLGLFAKTRNWLAHEYLDMSFDRIEKFIKIAGSVYPALATHARRKISESFQSEKAL